MFEQSKAAKRRYRDGDFLARYFAGNGIDVGAGPDSLARYAGMFPLMRSVRGWDLPDGDAQLLASVPDASYDFLHASHCLEHMREPASALANWIRVVRPGGHLVITVPDEDLYERGVFPSRFNSDHKWTFTLHKPPGMSWSPCSVNVLDLLAAVSISAEVERVCLLREFFDPASPNQQDQTQLPNAECAIEFVLRKRLPGDPARAAEPGIPAVWAAATVPAAGASFLEGNYSAPLGRSAMQLIETGQGEAAERKALEALLADPADCLALDVLVRRYLGSARYRECVSVLERLVRYTPDSAAAWNNLGCCYAEVRDLARAREAFERSSRCDAAYLPAYAGLAAVHFAQGETAKSEQAYRTILERNPDDLDAQVNLANSLLAQDRAADAAQAVKAPAARLLPDLGAGLPEVLPAPRPAADMVWSSRIDNQPIFESAHARLGMALVAMDRTREGLALLERRLSGAFIPGLDLHRAQRLWRGESLRGKTLMLLWEQGYGDVFQALRHVRWLAGQAGRVVLPADDSCRALFENSFADLGDRVNVVGWRDTIAPFDYYVSMLSLHDRAERAGYPQPLAEGGYLAVDAARRERFTRLRVRENALAVGLVWAGRPELMQDAQRSLPLAEVEKLVAPMKGVRFYSLQVGPRSLESARLAASGVVDWSVNLETFADTAAAMAALDMGVYVDTAAVHLAGALGVESLMLNRFGSEYRWGQGREDSRWYRSVRQLRQESPHDWSKPIAEARRRLAHAAATGGFDAVVPASGAQPACAGEALAAMGRIETYLGARDLPAAREAIDRYEQEHGESARVLCHRGVLEAFAGNTGPAREAFDRALQLQPDYAVAFSNRASVRSESDEQGREDDLLCSVAFSPAFAAGWANLARVTRMGSRPVLAHRHARRAQLLFPADESFRLLRGECALDAGDFADALEQFEVLRDAHPQAAESYANLIPVLGMMGRQTEARAALDRALALDPQHAAALNNGIQLYLRAQKYDDALELARQYALALPGKPGPLVSQALALYNLKRYDEALKALDEALAIDPHNLEGLFTQGTVYERMDRIDESEAALRRALQVKRDYRSMINLAVTLNRQQKYREARALNDEAIAASGERMARELELRMAAFRAQSAKEPFRAEMQTVDLGFGPEWNNALIDLAEGDYRRGFEGYERRLAHQTIPGLSENEQRTMRWRGESLSGKRLLLLPEQGYGDVIQFIRYLPELKRRGAYVLAGGSAPLARLLRHTPGIDEVVPLDQARRPAFDYWSPIMSLAYQLGVAHPGDLLPPMPYIGMPQEISATWALRVRELGDGPKVGLVWAGRKIYPADRLRSIPLAALQRAVERPHVKYISLQVGECAAEAAEWPQMTDWTADLVDFADTAALVSHLDLVIAVDTAVCHLAGALGKPVWMLNRVSTDWRWGPVGESCAWYPSMRIFRQTQMLDWREPLQQVSDAIDSHFGAATGAGLLQP